MQKLFAVSWIIVFISGVLSAQSSGTISGFVYDDQTGEALIGANVFIPDTYIGSSTNSMGFFSIPDIPPGSYELTCRYMGYKTRLQDIKVRPGRKQEIEFFLKPAAIYSEKVTVVADSARTSTKLYRKPISEISVTPRQIESIPQVVEADLLRSLQTMPGIAAVSDFSSELYVRGGTPDQNLYLIDGTDVYNPEHLFGLFSTFNTDAIKHVEISKGGFGAEYGGRLSSVLNVTNLDGNRRSYTGKTSISLLSAKTTLQMPLGDLGALSGSFRRTYFDKTVAKLPAFKDENIPNYYFYDGHLKAYLDLGPHDKLTLSVYKGQDDMDQVFDAENDNSQSLLYRWGNTTASARWTHIFSSKLFANFWLTSSSFDSYFEFADNIDETNNIDDRTLKGNLEYFYNQKLNVKAGFEFKQLNGVYTSVFPGGETDVTQSPVHAAAYIQTEWTPSPLFELQAGLRYNASWNNVNQQDIDPRLSLKYRLSETVNLKAATGRYHQYLFRIPRLFVADIWSASDQYYDVSQSDHYIVGLQKEVAENYSLEIEAYYKNYDNIYHFDPFFWIDLRPDSYNDKGEPLYTSAKGLFHSASAKAYGLEVLMRRDQGPLTGWLSYTLGRVENTVPELNSGNVFVPRHDRTHTLNLVSNIDVKNALRGLRGQPMHADKKSWQFGVNFVYASGQPITTTKSVYVTQRMPDQAFYTGYYLYPTERNNFRLPPYVRLDLSMTYKRQFKNFRLEPYLQIFNVTNRRNVWFIDYQDELNDNRIVQNIDTQGMLPILPSIGMNLIF
ncbi:MAG: TonB-dependent receptor [candidate division KSB1 bacterium]|nr:TonB-dependent receptor [candidate division KSB1 bacterium]